MVPVAAGRFATFAKKTFWINFGGDSGGFLGDAAFFAYSWKLPAYSGALLLTVENFSFFTYT